MRNWKYQGKRNYSTCIYFLLSSDSFSAFHRINQDEIWHFYEGSPIKLHLITPNGKYSTVIIGRDFEKDEVPQYAISGGIWFAATVLKENSFSLVGCTVAPGFNFQDFELAERERLTSLFPKHHQIISELCRTETT